MANGRVPQYAAPIMFDDAAAKGSLVKRDSADAGISIGPLRTTDITNTGGQAHGAISTAVDATLDGSQTFVEVDTTAAVRTITLPPVATSIGFLFYIVRSAGANNAVVQGNGGAETIQISGASGFTTNLTAIGMMLVVWCNAAGTKWYGMKV